jgi:hypothetical protein
MHKPFINDKYIEEYLIKEVDEFSWGLSQRVRLPIKGEDKPCMVYVPLYGIGGENIKSKLKIDGFKMKYFKYDKESKENTLVRLKIVTKVVDIDDEKDIDNPEETEINYNFEFDVESIKGISMIKEKEDKDFFKLYITIRHLPEVFKVVTTLRNDSKQRYSNVTRIKNPLWSGSDNLLKNWLNPHLMFRVSGEYDDIQKRKFSEEFWSIISQDSSRISYANIPSEKEEIMRSNMMKMLNGEKPFHEFKETLEKLPFWIQYTVLCLLCCKFINLLAHSYDELKEAMILIYELSSSIEYKDHVQNLDMSLRNIRSFDKRDKSIPLKEQINKNFEDMKLWEDRRNKKRSMPVRRIVITPSTIEFKLATRNMPNRVIRKFEENLDDFIRVAFQGENHRADRYNRDNNLPLLDHIETLMRHGFEVGNKKFQFLHYSNSQMKAHSCWFMNEGALKIEDVIQSLGNFEKETKLSKNAARKGQAFSSATKVGELICATQVEEIEDIERNGKIFSDGWGEIKAEYAKQIARESFDYVHCSAFQIRMGGCKGVLVKSNNEFNGDVKVKIRKSMKKFEQRKEDEKVDLEVIRAATYSCGYLNKQIIGILWSNGVEPEIFIDMQEKYVKEILDFSRFERKIVKDEVPFMLFSAIKHIDQKLYYVHKEGIEYMNDPFVGPLIKLVWYSKLREVKKRFRIFDKNWCVLIGVIDPYNWLEEGEVYVQPNVRHLSAKGRGAKGCVPSEYLNGTVLVSRNPWVHSGDVRKLKAVSKKELHGYENVIVFSSKGDRPEQDKMASGDLDGDIYWINWNQNFIDGFQEQPPNGDEEFKALLNGEVPEQPKEKTELKSIEMLQEGLSSSKITRESWINNFINYIKNDLLGEVANLHCKISDTSREMIKSEICLELAEMHSKAVDFQKHGEMLNVDRFNEIQRENNINVDFMVQEQKTIKKSKVKKSPGVLGQMHRALKDSIDLSDFLNLEYKYKFKRNYPLPVDVLGYPKIWEHFWYIYEHVVYPYNLEIHKIMVEKNLFTESDIFNINTAFSNIVNKTDEKYGHEADIESILFNLKEQLRYDVLDNYIKEVKLKGKTRKQAESEVYTALKFVSYFELHHEEESKLGDYLEQDGYKQFVKIKERENSVKEEIIKFDEYNSIVGRLGLIEEVELEKIIKHTKILSAWWYLTS